MKKIKLTENELTKIISNVINEQSRNTDRVKSTNSVEDVINRIGDVDLDKWWVGGGVEDQANCDRIKACLHYTIQASPGPQWKNFINCMMGDFTKG